MLPAGGVTAAFPGFVSPAVASSITKLTPQRRPHEVNSVATRVFQNRQDTLKFVV
jgi:hypothetical protein